MAGGYGALLVLVTPAGAVLAAQIVLTVSEDGETAFAAICFVVARNPVNGAFFNGLLRVDHRKRAARYLAPSSDRTGPPSRNVE